MRPPRSFAHVKRTDGYRSRSEARYARFLQWLLSLGRIRKWEYEPKTFWFDAPAGKGRGVRRGVTSYKPDFRVTMIDGSIEWHEVKGWMSPRDRTKHKRFALYYPGETLVVRDAAYMKALQRQLGRIIEP